jgi:hypothetical protein
MKGTDACHAQIMGRSLAIRGTGMHYFEERFCPCPSASPPAVETFSLHPRSDPYGPSVLIKNGKIGDLRLEEGQFHSMPLMQMKGIREA